MLESTEPLYWLDLTFGLTGGWWKFSDRHLRPDHPLISAQQWQTLLKRSGFETVSSLLAEGSRSEGEPTRRLAQTVLVAQRSPQLSTAFASGRSTPAWDSSTPLSWLILAEGTAPDLDLDQRGSSSNLGEHLATWLAQQGIQTVLAYAGEAYQWQGPQGQGPQGQGAESPGCDASAPATHRLSLNPNHPEDFARLLQELEQQRLSPARVLYGWSLAADAEPTPVSQQSGSSAREVLPLDAIAQGCMGLLFLSQALIRSAVPSQLVVVTQGAASVGCVDPTQAAAWGARPGDWLGASRSTLRSH